MTLKEPLVSSFKNQMENLMVEMSLCCKQELLSPQLTGLLALCTTCWKMSFIMRHLLNIELWTVASNKDFQRFWNLAEACFKNHSAPYCKTSQNGKCKHCSQVTSESHILFATSLKFFPTLVSSIPETLATKLTIFSFTHALQPIWDMRTDEGKNFDIMLLVRNVLY